MEFVISNCLKKFLFIYFFVNRIWLKATWCTQSEKKLRCWRSRLRSLSRRTRSWNKKTTYWRHWQVPNSLPNSRLSSRQALLPHPLPPHPHPHSLQQVPQHWHSQLHKALAPLHSSFINGHVMPLGLDLLDFSSESTIFTSLTANPDKIDSLQVKLFKWIAPLIQSDGDWVLNALLHGLWYSQMGWPTSQPLIAMKCPRNFSDCKTPKILTLLCLWSTPLI